MLAGKPYTMQFEPKNQPDKCIHDPEPETVLVPYTLTPETDISATGTNKYTFFNYCNMRLHQVFPPSQVQFLDPTCSLHSNDL
jgi:hypothetical protein